MLRVACVLRSIEVLPLVPLTSEHATCGLSERRKMPPRAMKSPKIIDGEENRLKRIPLVMMLPRAMKSLKIIDGDIVSGGKQTEKDSFSNGE